MRSVKECEISNVLDGRTVAMISVTAVMKILSNSMTRANFIHNAVNVSFKHV